MTAGGRWATVKADFALRRLPATLAIGLVLALVNALLTVALMSLIFTGPLNDSLPLGVGAGLVASAALGLAIGLLSGFPGMYAGIQDNSAAILGLAAASIAASVVGPDGIDTVLAMIATTSLATGMVFLLMGTFRLGEIAKFVPFPVIGGLLAGTGYLILDGSLDILGTSTSFDHMVSADALGLMWPGIAFAAAFLVAARRNWPSQAYLGLLAGGIAGFHLFTQLAGIDKAESLTRGWLLGPFPSGGLWPGFAAETLAGADWSAIAGEAASLLTILILVPVTLLLSISALEIGTNSDLDLNAELRATGWGNVAAGAVGGPPGFFYLSDTLVAHRIVGGRRGPTVVAAFAVFGIVFVGGSVLELLPQFVIGGLLLFVGVDFLVEWLWTSRRRMTRLDYALMVAIVVTIATVGFLPGVAAGLAAAIALFVFRYSRINVVKHLLTAKVHRSNIERPVIESDYLLEVGDSVLVLELHGFIFFGTVNQIVDKVKTSLRDTGALRFVIFDFRLVTGLDSSAIAVFERIALLARDHGLTLLLSGLRPSHHEQFAEFIAGDGDVVRVEPDLDHAMAWCEDRLLEDLDAGEDMGRPLPEGLEERLAGYLDAKTIQAGDNLMRQGDPTPGIFLITSGRATVLLQQPNGDTVRLRTLREGTVLGEIGLYRREPCTATVVADTPCDVLHLSPESFDDLCRNNPAAAADLHAFVARILAGRVSHANRTIRALHS